MKKWNEENSPVGSNLTNALNMFGADEVRHLGGNKFEAFRHIDGQTLRMIADEGDGCTEHDCDCEIFEEEWRKKETV